MKKIWKKIVSVIIALTLLVSNLDIYVKEVEGATVFLIDNIQYEIVSSSEFTVQVVGANGSLSKNLMIPSTVKQDEEEYTVIKIKNSAFINNTEITSLDIQEGVTMIEQDAFKNCTALSTVEFPESLTNIQGSAFCNTGIKNLVLPKKLQTIIYGAFADCTQLTSIWVPKTITTVGGTMSGESENTGPFRGCSNIETVEFEEGIEAIPKQLFANTNCKAIENIVIPTTVKKINEGAFLNCSNLEKIEIPDGVTEISSFAFYGCSSLKTIDFGTGLEKIGESAFKNCTALSTVEFPESLTNIQGSAFSDCTNLKTVKFISGDSLEIGNKVFYNCEKLSEVCLSSNLISMGASTFGNCISLKNISIPKSLTSNISAGVSSVSNGPFAGCVNLKKINLEEGMTTIASNLFANMTWLTSINIPEGVENIGNGAFAGCTNLNLVTMPDSLQSIGENAFYNTPKLKKVYLNENVKEINNNSFDTSVSFYLSKFSESMMTFINAEKDVNFYTTENKYAGEYVIDSVKSIYNVNSNNGNSNIALNITYKIKDEYVDDITNMKLVVKVPTTSDIGYIKLDDKFLAENDYKITGKNMITIPVINTSGKCVIYVSPDENGKMNSYATLEYVKEEVEYVEIIGAISEVCPVFTLNILDEINYNENDELLSLEVKGAGIAGNTVEIYIDDILFTEVIVSKGRRYFTTVYLPEPTNGKEYVIKVVSMDAKGNKVTLQKTVIAKKDCPVLTEATLYIEAHEYEGGYETFDLLNADAIKYITFQPNKPYKFIIRYANMDSIQTVMVISNRAGVQKKLEAIWNEEQGAYITEGYFGGDSNYVPGNISIEYIEKKEDVVVETEEGYEISETVKEQVPDVWTEASVEVIEKQENYESYEIELGNGELVNLVTEDMSIEEYAKKIKEQTEEESENGAIIDNIVVNTQLYISSKNNDNYQELIASYKDYGFVNYSNGNNNVLVKAEVSDDKISGYFIDEKDNDRVRAFTLEMLTTTSESYFGWTIEKISGSKTAGTYGDIFMLSLTSAVDANNIFMDTEQLKEMINSINADPNLTSAEKNALMNEIKTQATVDILSAAVISVSTCMLVAGMILGVSTPMMIALSVITYGAMRFFDSEYFRDYLQGKMSLPECFLRWIIDPSGYIYEGVTNNRLSGVTVTAYYKASLEEEAILWNASEYDQMNPLITDSTGSYAWDVPEGYWQVKAEKEGYETVYSDWMPVPPVQTDVNLNMHKTTAPKVKGVEVFETFTLVEFDQYMDPQFMKNLIIRDSNGEIVSTEVIYDDSETDTEGNAFAHVFKMEYIEEIATVGETFSIEVNENILGASGLSVESDVIVTQAQSHIQIEYDEYLDVCIETDYEVQIILKEMEINDISITVENASIITVSEAIFTEEDVYTISISPLALGDTKFTVSIADYGIEREIPVRVKKGIVIHGNQISATKEGTRTIYSIENNINGKDVVSVGMLYSLGDYVGEEELYVGSTNYYVANFEATTKGVSDTNYSGSETATSYIMTMLFGVKNAAEFSATWRLKAYVQLEDGTYLYSDAYEYTIFNVAEKLYQGLKMSNYAWHNYLYTGILKVVDPEYREKSYDWNNSIV